VGLAAATGVAPVASFRLVLFSPCRGKRASSDIGDQLFPDTTRCVAIETDAIHRQRLWNGMGRKIMTTLDLVKWARTSS